MIVADANLIIYVALETEALTEKALEVFGKDHVWVSPDYWKIEASNVLSTHVRLNKITLSQAHEAFEAMCELVDEEFVVDFSRLITTSQRTGCSGFDAGYVMLAEDLNVKLVSADKKLLARCPNVGVSPEQFLAA